MFPFLVCRDLLAVITTSLRTDLELIFEERTNIDEFEEMLIEKLHFKNVAINNCNFEVSTPMSSYPTAFDYQFCLFVPF